MKPRDVAALALLVVAVGVEVMVFQGVFTLASFDFYERNHAALSRGTFFAVSHGSRLLGMLAGGALALGIGPRFTAAGGAFLATLGCLALAAGLLEPALYVVSFGCGVLRPCPIVAAAEVIAWDDASPASPGPHRFALVAAFGAALTVAANGGGLVAGMCAPMARNYVGAAAAYGGAGALMILAAVLFMVAAFLGVRWSRVAAPAPVAGPYREPTAPASVTVPRPRALSALGKLLGLQVGYLLMTSLTSPPGALRAGASAASITWLYELPFAGGTLGSVLTLAVLIVMAHQRSSWPPLLLQGAALVVFALGLVSLAITSTSMVSFGVGAVLTGLASGAANCVSLAYAALAVRGRAATLVVAGWCVIEGLVGQGGTLLNLLEPARVPILVTGVLLCLGGGAALLRFGRALHRGFDPVGA